MPDPTPPTIDDVIVALQKSISRVNDRTGSHMDALRETGRSDAEVSMLDGPVNWRLQCQVQPEGDKLFISEQGIVHVELSGRVTVPIGLEEPNTSEDDGHA